MSGASGGTSGGSVGSSGSAGSGGSSAGPGPGCPDMPPQDGGLCTVQTPDNCFYPGAACSCLSDSNGPIRHWGCYGTPDKCPNLSDGLPVDGASCKTFGAGAQCPYSSTSYCVCIPGLGGGSGGGGDPRWACNADPAPPCPGLRPDKNAFCAAVKECAYVDLECFCDGFTWACE
jgi:hypothetical protein